MNIKEKFDYMNEILTSYYNLLIKKVGTIKSYFSPYNFLGP
jgi:hypothetical protein